MAVDWTKNEAFIAASPGASWTDEQVQEIIDNVSALSAVIVGPYNFNGLAGVGITFDTRGNTDYFMSIMPLSSSPTGNIGDVTFARLTATTAAVYNTGSSEDEFYVRVEAVTT